MYEPTTEDETADSETSYWRRLLRRWFVEHNPLYILSAALVLGGMILLSKGLAREGSLHGGLGVAAIAELYAVALIGGAALLTRIGQRRPAVMLGLLTVLYQWDLTLHTEAAANLGPVGVWASGAWLALFVGKLHALAWAMKVRLSRRAFATATLGAAGLTLLPHALPLLEPRSGTAVVATWLFALGASYPPRSVESLVDLDAWGRVVLRRTAGAGWIGSALFVVLHVLFWSTIRPLEVGALACVLPLLAARQVRTEGRVWIAAASTLLFVGWVLPGTFAAIALLGAFVLGERALAALRSVREAPDAPTPDATGAPYRAVDAGGPPGRHRPLRAAGLALVDPAGARASAMRLLTGAVFSLYLSVWTRGWVGGPWPAHVIALDLVVTATVLAAVWRTRVRLAVAPLAITWVHLVVQARLVPPPRSLLEWGGAAVALGFGLLLASLAASYRLREARGPSRAPDSAAPLISSGGRRSP